MKKIIAILSILLCILLLASCTSKQPLFLFQKIQQYTDDAQGNVSAVQDLQKIDSLHTDEEENKVLWNAIPFSKADQQLSDQLTKSINTLIVNAYYYNFTQENDIGQLYSLLTNGLKKEIEQSTHFNDIRETVKKYDIVTVINSVSIMPLNYVKMSSDQQKIKLGGYIMVDIDSLKNDAFRKDHPEVTSTIMVDLWVYFSRDDSGKYEIYKWTETTYDSQLNPAKTTSYSEDGITSEDI